METPVVVRDAVPDDTMPIADLHVESWRVAYRGIMDDDVLDSPTLVESRRFGWTQHLHEGFNHTGDPEHRLFVATIDGVVVGFGHVGRESDPVDDAHDPAGEVYGFYLHPDAWGTGVADALMDRCLDELRRRGFERAILWVLRDNPRARRFYERHGFGPTDHELMWDGPTMPGAPTLREPVAEIQYRIDLTV
jgi:ribosomal protein S18 acetylase RimI-like enzyme